MAFKRSAVRSRLSPPSSPENQWFSGLGGGDKRDRTADLLNAIQALSQLSYTPKFNSAVAQLLYYTTGWGFVKWYFAILGLNGLDGGGQGGDGIAQGQGGRALLRQIGNMYKTNSDRGVRVVVQQAIQRIVAHKCAGAIGNDCVNACVADGVCHDFGIQCCEVGGRTVVDDALAAGLIAGVVRDFCVANIDGNPFGCDGGAPSGLTDTQDCVGIEFLCRGKDGLCRFFKNGGDFKLAQKDIADSIGELSDGFPGRVNRPAAERVEACDQKFLHGITPFESL